MLSVILLILKIIGITILVLLGIIIFIVLIILFVPIRYRIKVEHGDALSLDGGVSWLLHIIHARITQSAGSRRIWIRIMGIFIYDSLRPPKKKRARSRSKISKKDINHGKDDQLRKSVAEDDSGIDGEKPVSSEISSDDIRAEDNKEKDNKNKNNKNKNNKNNDINNNDIKNSNIENNNIRNDNVDYQEIKSKNKLIGLYKRIRVKIISFFKAIQNKLRALLHKLMNIKGKISLILNFINDDINKSGFLFTFNSLKKILKHILPRTLKSRFIFGTGDPCSTGQLLGVFAILYSFYGDNLQITPDFENKVFKGSHYARGRIRIWTLLVIVIKLLLDKRFKELKMNYQLLKEAL